MAPDPADRAPAETPATHHVLRGESDPERDEILALFVAEAEQRVADMEGLLLRLRTRSAPDDVVDTLLRHAHTLKGNSACMGFAGVSEYALGMESVFRRLDQQRVSPDDDLVALLLDAVAALRELIADAVAGRAMRASHLGLLERLARWTPGTERRAA